MEYVYVFPFLDDVMFSHNGPYGLFAGKTVLPYLSALKMKMHSRLKALYKIQVYFTLLLQSPQINYLNIEFF